MLAITKDLQALIGKISSTLEGIDGAVRDIRFLVQTIQKKVDRVSKALGEGGE